MHHKLRIRLQRLRNREKKIIFPFQRLNALKLLETSRGNCGLSSAIEFAVIPDRACILYVYFKSHYSNAVRVLNLRTNRARNFNGKKALIHVCVTNTKRLLAMGLFVDSLYVSSREFYPRLLTCQVHGNTWCRLHIGLEKNKYTNIIRNSTILK